MKNSLTISLVFLMVYQVLSAQNEKDTRRLKADTIDGIYIPKNLEDCFVQIDKMLNDSIKIEIKKKTEDDFSADSHFGLGKWVRNNWGLWAGSRLSKYFNKMDIYHPDDMSGIIVTSYYRKLTGKEIDLEKQIKFYKSYWTAVTSPSKKQYPKGLKEAEFNETIVYHKENELWGCLHIQTDSKTDELWVYDYYHGWKLTTNEELKLLRSTKEQNLDEIIRTLFGK